MSNPYEPAIAALEQRLQDHERKANELRGAINTLCEAAGVPPRYPDGGGGGGRASNGSLARPLTQIKSDTFFGQKQTTAIRSYLDMRRAQSLGPASPKEIFEALKQGGYQFGAQKEETAMVSLRALLRKNNATFLRVPNTGTYGLRSWYPHAKIGKAQTGDADQNQSQSDGGDLDSDDAEAVETDNEPMPRASVSLMITQEQKAQLRQRGFTDDQIRQMKPAEAHRVLGLAADADEASTAA